ncbi:MAG: metallophosphoesterase [Desulfobacterium sp.]|nr:metallophosphoesterase [Desulfobacterium sp.]
MESRCIFQKVSGWIAIGLISIIMGLMGCSNDSTESASGTTENGELVISLTDAEGDFSSYTVDVLSINLTKQNGAVVSTLPVTTRVDFAQYTDMTEFLTASTIPSGVYTEASLTLDYQNADIWVENSDGDLVKVNAVVDEDGNPITTITVSVHLEDSNSLLIAPGIPAHLTLDFDLISSNKVEFGNDGTPTLTVEAVLLADIDPEDSKTHRMRGPLGSVDVAAGTFELILRPFFHAISGKDKKFGSLTVTTLESTVYDINGQQYEGAAGLSALNEQTEYTAVVVTGDLKFHPYRFEATEVSAGSSVPGGTLDAVTGNVIRRDGNTVVMKGATLIRNNGRAIFNDTVTVLLDEDTIVKRQLSQEDFTIRDISVGQLLTAFGVLTNSDKDSLELNATGDKNGYVRMKFTTVRGTVVDHDTALTLDLQSINACRIGIFDFSGTGTDSEKDADPENYEISTGTLDISSYGQNDSLKVIGFINGFGQAPADFLAQTIVDVTDVRSFMRITWAPASATPFETLSSEKIVITQQHHGKFHHLGRAGVIVNLDDLSSLTTIQPLSASQGRFLIKYRESNQFYSTFKSFVLDLEGLIEDGKKVQSMFATGSFDRTNAILTADCIEFRMK